MKKISYTDYLNLKVDNKNNYIIIANKNSGRIGLIINNDLFYGANDLLGFLLEDYPPMISFNVDGEISVTCTFDLNDDLYLIDINEFSKIEQLTIMSLFKDYSVNNNFACNLWKDKDKAVLKYQKDLIQIKIPN